MLRRYSVSASTETRGRSRAAHDDGPAERRPAAMTGAITSPGRDDADDEDDAAEEQARAHPVIRPAVGDEVLDGTAGVLEGFVGHARQPMLA